MGPASELGGALSEAVNCLCAFLASCEGSANGVAPVDGAELVAALVALETAASKCATAGPSKSALEPISAEDLARVARLRELISEWMSTGAFSSDAIPLGEQCVSALWGGASWRDLMGRRA